MKTISVKVFIDKEGREEKLKLKSGSVVSDLLRKLKINPVTVIIARNNEIILEDAKLHDKDEVKILSVISGG